MSPEDLRTVSKGRLCKRGKVRHDFYEKEMISMLWLSLVKKNHWVRNILSISYLPHS